MGKKDKLAIKFILTADLVQGANGGLILGDFNNWNTEQAQPLQAQEDGSMLVTLELEAGKSYQYRYLLSDGRWVNDHGFRIQSEVYGHPVENSFIQVPDIEKKRPTPKKKEDKPKEKKPKAVKKQAVTTEKPEPPADDLTKIEGIGKKISSLLKQEQILTYKDLSKLTIKKLQAILDTAGPKYALHNPSTWPKQAKLAAAGEWEKLGALQASLKAGLPNG